MPRSTASGRRSGANGSWSIAACPSPGPKRPASTSSCPTCASSRTAANLLGIVITHAHEDHIGALAELWPQLRAPVYCTRFAAGLLATRRLSRAGRAEGVAMQCRAAGRARHARPVRHRVRAGRAFDPGIERARDPHAGRPRRPYRRLEDRPDAARRPADRREAPARARRRGRAGAGLRFDQRHARRRQPERGRRRRHAEGTDRTRRRAASPSPPSPRTSRACAPSPRPRWPIGREVVVVGRAMDRVIDVARECGYLDGIPAFRSADTYGYLPRDKVVALLTGSQGEPRAALARIAPDDHPEIALSPGDRVIFSSRTIPGNEKAVGNIINALARDKIEVITDRTHLVHVSGHPRRDEMARLYGWLKPQIAIPAHGEALHLAEHASFARSLGVKHRGARRQRRRRRDHARRARSKIDEVPHGRLYQDGIAAGERAGEDDLRSAASSSFAGIVSVAIAIDEKGGIAGEPEIAVLGLPPRDPRRHRFRRIRRRYRRRPARRHAEGQAPRSRGPAQRARARRAQRRQRGVGQEAAGPCAGDRGATIAGGASATAPESVDAER